MVDLAGQPSAKPSGRRPWLRAGAACSVVVAVIGAGWLLFGADNLRVVVPGQVLRSAQPSPADLARLARARDLRSVINLRSTGLDHDWLRAETAASSSLGIDLYSIGFSPTEWPPQSRVRELVRVLDSAPRPVLLHCRRGTDRAGWASAVVRMLAGDPPARALSELDVWHGHLCDQKTCPLHRFFASYAAYRERTGLEHSGATFRHWVLEVYCPEQYHAEIELEEPLPDVVTAGAPLKVAARVRNAGRDGWVMRAAQGGVRLGVRAVGPLPAPPPDEVAALRAAEGASVDLGRADAAPGELAPGGELRLAVSFAAPRRPGLYILQVDMVQELVHWFSDMGGPGVLVRLRVTSCRDASGRLTATGSRP